MGSEGRSLLWSPVLFLSHCLSSPAFLDTALTLSGLWVWEPQS